MNQLSDAPPFVCRPIQCTCVIARVSSEFGESLYIGCRNATAISQVSEPARLVEVIHVCISVHAYVKYIDLYICTQKLRTIYAHALNNKEFIYTQVE